MVTRNASPGAASIALIRSPRLVNRIVRNEDGDSSIDCGIWTYAYCKFTNVIGFAVVEIRISTVFRKCLFIYRFIWCNVYANTPY